MKVEALILAAGNSSRLGRPKQLLQYRGKTLIRQTAEKALSICPSTTVILADSQKSMQAELHDLSVRIRINPLSENGMGSSIAVGAKALQPDTDALLLLLCDQPLITTADLLKLLREFEQRRPDVLISKNQEILSPPAIIGPNCFHTLKNLSGDKGLRELIRQENSGLTVKKVLLKNAGLDIDTEADVSKLKNL